MTDTNTEVKNTTPVSAGPGLHLRQAREAKGITVDEVAKRLRLNKQRVFEIENDQYSNLGAGTFARGYLRAYARFVGVSDTDILKEFNEMDYAATIKSKKPELLQGKPLIINPRSSRSFSYLLILLVIILAGFWWHNHKSKTKVTTNTIVPATETVNDNDTVNKVLPLSITSQQPTTQSLPLQEIPGEQKANAIMNQATVNPLSTTQPTVNR